MADGQVTKDVVILEVQINTSGGSGGANSTPEKNKKDIDAVATSILGLQQANKKLREERNKLDASTEEGQKKIRSLNAELDKNNKTIKDNSSALEKQRLNIGNYASALDKLVPGLGGAVQGIGGMTKASYAFIATGIGAIIAAVGLALAALVSYFKSSGDGADKFAKIADQAGAVINVLVDRVAALVRTLGAFLSGDFKGGIDGLRKTFGGLGDEIAREVKLAGELADLLDELEDREKDYAVSLSETSNQIKKLILQSKDRTLSEQERINKLNEAMALEKKSNDELLAIKKDALRAAVLAAQQQANTTQKENESLEEYAKRLKDTQTLKDELRDGVRAALTEVNAAIGESLNLQEKIDNQINALREKRDEEIKKREADSQKASDEAREKRISDYEAEVERLIQIDERRKEYLKTFNLEVKEDTAKSLDAITKIRKQQTDAQVKAEKEKAKKIIEANEAETAGRRAATDAALGFARSAFGESKALAIAETVINTIRGIVRAVADYPFPYSAIVGALVGAAGTLQTARISGIKFAQGGEIPNRMTKHWTVGGNSHAQGGTKYYGSDGNVIEAERGEGIYVMKRTAEEARSLSAHNVAHGGRSWMPGAYPGITRYADGGAVAMSKVEQGSSRDIVSAFREVMTSLPPIYVHTTEIAESLDSRSAVINRATVIG